MPLTELDKLRLAVQDTVQSENAIFTGNGLDTRFELAHLNATSGTAYQEIQNNWIPFMDSPLEPNPIVFSTSGYVDLGSRRVSAGSAFRVTYVHSVFTDDELAHFMDAGGSLRGAQIEAIEALMFDSLKRAQWSAPGGTSYNDTAAQAQLVRMHERLLKQTADEAISGGRSIGWE